MGKKGSLVFILLFFCACCVPGLGMLLLGESDAAGNEVLSPKPQLKHPDGSWNLEVMSDAADYFADHFAFRQELIDLQGEDLVYRGEEKVCVLKHPQHAQVQHQGDSHHQLVPGRGRGAGSQKPAGSVVDHTGEQHQQHVHRLSKGIKQQADHQQKQVFQPDARKNPGEHKHCRQKKKQENS